VDHLVELLKAFVWPAVVVFLAMKFGGPLHGVLKAVAEGRASLKAGPSGVEITQATQSAVGVAIASGVQARDAPPAEQAAIAQGIVHAARTSLSNASALAARRILWVDDNPSNNALLVRSFRDLGITVAEVRSTDEAMKALAANTYDLVITDMGRSLDWQAGLTLLRRMREAGRSIPAIIYAARWASEHRGEEAEYQAALITNRPDEVYARALAILQERR
jgi:CheY-like chemotaxis protein